LQTNVVWTTVTASLCLNTLIKTNSQETTQANEPDLVAHYSALMSTTESDRLMVTLV
jgi:hypothetical protein